MKPRTLSLIVPAFLLVAAPATALELEFYGVGHLSADSVDDGQDRSQFLASNSSRLGLRGSHELGRDLSVVFQYEQGVDLTGQGGNDGNGPGSTAGLFTAARDSFLGLTGNFGTVRVGKLGGLNQWVYDYNLFADQVGDLGNLWGGTGLPGRVTNAAQYATPSFNGFTLGLTYVPEEGVDDADLFVFKADYAIAGLKLGAAWLDLSSDWSAAALTASYEFGQFSVGGGWQREESIADVSGNDRDSYTLGAAFALGNGVTLKAQLVQSDADVADADATQWAVGLDYQWDPALTVYVAFAGTSNDDNAAFSANNYGKGDAVFPAAGDDPNAVSVGVVYRFGIAPGK